MNNLMTYPMLMSHVTSQTIPLLSLLRSDWLPTEGAMYSTHRQICHALNIVNVMNFFIPALICKYFYFNLYLFILCPLISIGF